MSQVQVEKKFCTSSEFSDILVNENYRQQRKSNFIEKKLATLKNEQNDFLRVVLWSLKGHKKFFKDHSAHMFFQMSQTLAKWGRKNVYLRKMVFEISVQN